MRSWTPQSSRQVKCGSGNPAPHIPSQPLIYSQGNMLDGTVPGLALTIRPAHGVIQHAGDTPPQGALGRVARVHAPCVVIIAPVQLVLKEISPVIVGPGEDSIDAAWREAEVGDGSRVPFLYVVVLKHPVSVSWWREKEPQAAAKAPGLTFTGVPPSSPKGLYQVVTLCHQAKEEPCLTFNEHLRHTSWCASENQFLVWQSLRDKEPRQRTLLCDCYV